MQRTEGGAVSFDVAQSLRHRAQRGRYPRFVAQPDYYLAISPRPRWKCPAKKSSADGVPSRGNILRADQRDRGSDCAKRATAANFARAIRTLLACTTTSGILPATRCSRAPIRSQQRLRRWKCRRRTGIISAPDLERHMAAGACEAVIACKILITLGIPCLARC